MSAADDELLRRLAALKAGTGSSVPTQAPASVPPPPPPPPPVPAEEDLHNRLLALKQSHQPPQQRPPQPLPAQSEMMQMWELTDRDMTRFFTGDKDVDALMLQTAAKVASDRRVQGTTLTTSTGVVVSGKRVTAGWPSQDDFDESAEVNAVIAQAQDMVHLYKEYPDLALAQNAPKPLPSALLQAAGLPTKASTTTGGPHSLTEGGGGAYQPQHQRPQQQQQVRKPINGCADAHRAASLVSATIAAVHQQQQQPQKKEKKLGFLSSVFSRNKKKNKPKPKDHSSDSEDEKRGSSEEDSVSSRSSVDSDA